MAKINFSLDLHFYLFSYYQIKNIIFLPSLLFVFILSNKKYNFFICFSFRIPKGHHPYAKVHNYANSKFVSRHINQHKPSPIPFHFSSNTYGKHLRIYACNSSNARCMWDTGHWHIKTKHMAARRRDCR